MNYEYQCEKCGKIQEIRHSIKENPEVKHMDGFTQDQPGEGFYIKCGGKMKRIISKISGFILRGPGFYQNDYKNLK